MLISRPKIFDEAARSHASKKLAAQIAAFIAVFIVIYILEGIVPAIVSNKPMNEALREQGFLDGDKKLTFKQSMKIAEDVMSKPGVMVPTLLSTVFGTIVSIIYCRYFEVRRVSSMGARKQGALRHYAAGLGIGALFMTVITLLTVAAGANSISVAKGANYGIIALYLFGFLVQGMSEEFIFRGYLMTTIGSSHSSYLAIGISAVMFGLMHSANPGLTPLAMFNLILFGVFAGVYVICFDNIWGVCGIHSIWNFAQGNIYGISVSGSSKAESVFTTSAESSHGFLTGGKFGIEGSIFTTIVLTAATAAVLYYQYRREKHSAGTVNVPEEAPENSTE